MNWRNFWAHRPPLHVLQGMIILLLVYATIAVALTGCLTTEEALYINSNFDRVPSRSEMEARNAEIACKNMARTLVQIARCEVRR